MAESVMTRQDVLDLPIEDRFPGWPFVGGGSQGDDGGGDSGGGDGAAAGGGEGAAATGDGGGDDGDPDSPSDLAQIAAEFDAEALGQLKDDDAATPSTEEGRTGKRGAPSSDDPIDAFIAKNYGGDRAAFVAGLHESRQEARRLADKIAVLESRGAAPSKDTAAELKAAFESDPNVQTLNHAIKTIDTRNNQIAARQLEIVNRANTLQATIAAGEAELPHLEDQRDWAKKYAALQRAQTELATLSGEYTNNETRQDVLSDRRDQRLRDLRQIEKEMRAEMAEREDSSRTIANSAARTRETFSAAFETYIKPYGISQSESPKRYAFVRESVRTLLADHLESLGDDAESLDAAGIYGAVNKLVAAWADAHEIKPRKGGAPIRTGGTKVPPTAPRRLITPTPRPRAEGQAPPSSRAAAPPRTLDSVLDDPELVRQRAEAIFSAAGKRRGGALA